MKSSELVNLLNSSERSQAWLARQLLSCHQLNYTATAVCHWCSGQVSIPERHVAAIKELLQ